MILIASTEWKIAVKITRNILNRNSLRDVFVHLCIFSDDVTILQQMNQLVVEFHRNPICFLRSNNNFRNRILFNKKLQLIDVNIFYFVQINIRQIGTV